jgi:hypothetical protein
MRRSHAQSRRPSRISAAATGYVVVEVLDNPAARWRPSRKAPTHDGCRKVAATVGEGAGTARSRKVSGAIAGHPELSIWPVPSDVLPQARSRALLGRIERWLTTAAALDDQLVKARRRRGPQCA